MSILFCILLTFLPFGPPQETELEYFSLTAQEIRSEGSIVFYSNSLTNLDSDHFLAIEGWNYDVEQRDYSYFCFIRLEGSIMKLEADSKSNDETKSEATYKSGELTVTIRTDYYKPVESESSEGESYYRKGTLTLKSGNSEISYKIFGLVAV